MSVVAENPAPTGTVSLKEGATTLDTQPLSAVMKLCMQTPASGTHNYTGHDSGDSFYPALDFGPFTVTVTAPGVSLMTTRLTPSATAVSWGFR